MEHAIMKLEEDLIYYKSINDRYLNGKCFNYDDKIDSLRTALGLLYINHYEKDNGQK